MKIRFLIILLLISFGASSQEYWDREDFEIGKRSIENSWREIGFTWQTESSFNISDGSFLHLKNYDQKQQVDMLAVIDKTNRTRVERKIDLGSPLPYVQREKKFIEVSVEPRFRDQNDVFTNPYFANPFLNNYNYRGFGMRNYARTRFVY